MNTAQKNKEMLQDLVTGGNGITGQWAEHVIYEATERHAECDGYIFHTGIRTYKGDEVLISTTLKTAQNLHALHYEDTDEQPQPLIIKETHRRISAEEQQGHHVSER